MLFSPFEEIRDSMSQFCRVRCSEHSIFVEIRRARMEFLYDDASSCRENDSRAQEMP